MVGITVAGSVETVEEGTIEFDGEGVSPLEQANIPEARIKMTVIPDIINSSFLFITRILRNLLY